MQMHHKHGRLWFAKPCLPFSLFSLSLFCPGPPTKVRFATSNSRGHKRGAQLANRLCVLPFRCCSQPTAHCARPLNRRLAANRLCAGRGNATPSGYIYIHIFIHILELGENCACSLSFCLFIYLFSLLSGPRRARFSSGTAGAENHAQPVPQTNRANGAVHQTNSVMQASMHAPRSLGARARCAPKPVPDNKPMRRRTGRQPLCRPAGLSTI